MTTLEFQPVVYRVVTNGIDGNTYTWDLLTVDGETPNNTVYFMLKDDSPSFSQSDAIVEAIEDEDWEEIDFESNYDLSDFSIDKSIFDTAGEGYEDIRKELENL